MGRFENKVAIVTGSSMGIGKAIARELLHEGAKVVINGRNDQRLQKTFESLQHLDGDVTMFAGDVSKMEDCQRLIQCAISRYGKIDILINNAGVSMEGEVERLSHDVFRKVMEVNVMGSAFMTKAALPFLRDTRGSVTFISSIAGFLGLPRFSVYSASKMALTAFAESLKTELYGSGVHVGIAYLGFTSNDPDKTIYAASGELVPQPSRQSITPEPVEVVARQILMMIERRQFKQVFSPLGKLTSIATRFSPRLFELFVRNQYWKRYRRHESIDGIDGNSNLKPA